MKFRILFLVTIVLIAGGSYASLNPDFLKDIFENKAGSIAIEKQEKNNAPKAVTPVRMTATEYMDRANVLLLQEEYSQAVRAAAEALKTEPTNADAYALLAQVHIRRGDAKRLSGVITQMKTLMPENKTIAEYEIQNDVLSRNFADAAQKLQALSAKGDLPPTLTITGGMLLALQNDHSGAQQQLNQATDDPRATALLSAYETFGEVPEGKDPHLFALLAKALAETNEFALSRKFADEALTEDPDYVDAWIIRGYVFQQQDELDFAIQDYRRAATLDPLRGRTHYLLATAYQAENKTEEAISAYEKALENGFEWREETLWQLVTLYQKQGNYPIMMQRYRELLDGNEANIDDFAPALQTALGIMNKPELALDFTLPLTQKFPESVRAWNLHGWALIRSDKLDEAQTALNAARDIMPENQTTWLNLGLLYEKMNRPQAAAKAYQQAIVFAETAEDTNTQAIATDMWNKLR